MTNVCRGHCERFYKFEKQGGNQKLYELGAKRCNVACNGIYVKWDGTFCPCCQGRLRSRPRKSKLKKKLLTSLSVKSL